MSLHSQTQSVKKLLKCVLTRNSKLYLGKVYTEDQLVKLSKEEVEKLFNNYEAKLSGQMVKLLGHSIINMYMMGAEIVKCGFWCKLPLLDHFCGEPTQ